MVNLSTPIQNIDRVGAATAKRLKKLGITTVYDLLFYFPFRYDDFRLITPIEKLRPGSSANIVGRVELIQNKRSPRRRIYITEALISDRTETIKVVWFNQPFIAKNLRVGDQVSLAGKIEGNNYETIMKSPIYEKISTSRPVHTRGLVPNYHLTANLTQKQIRFLVGRIIALADKIQDWLPAEIIKEKKFLTLNLAVKKIHFPASIDEIKNARARLGFNELFLLQLQSQLIKRKLRSSQSPPVPFLEKETKKMVNSLPFKLTSAQKKAAWEILQDMEKNRPMTRLLEGDVGSGKTVVAVIAMLNVALNKKQAVLMVPTEILAQQHFSGVSRLLAGFNINIGLITRSVKKINNNPKIINQKSGETEDKKIPNPQFVIRNSQIIIGTHALIQEKIKFNNLALAIIDEQHRFGVEQRKAIIEKSSRQSTAANHRPIIPHFLSMTATPIPRSLAMALYGDLDLSIINEMPKNRKPITTRIVPEDKRKDAYQFIRRKIEEGRQVFVICPLIDISDKLGVKSVKEEFKKLDKKIFPELSIGILHGRLKAKEKEKTMRDFLKKKIKILVSTSVVEVGVDAPNATIMMIEEADRFGLAQLHQFRGRVGRSGHQSYCFLFTSRFSTKPAKYAELADSEAEKSKKRLRALTTCHNGFELAKIDLKLRGPGQVYGTAQKGFPQFKIATLFDYQLMKQAREAAINIIKNDPTLNAWPGLKQKLGNWDKIAHPE